jgi:oligoribonuclease NrnB/cAMP/cGMP phosphodiesterase (DHH superfamily)
MKYVIYHKNCDDGTSSAYAAFLKLGSSAKYIELSYGEPVPNMPDCEFLYILDFSFNRETTKYLYDYTQGNIQVIDHHATAKDALDGLPYCIFNKDKCGAVLSWEYFHPESPIPLFFKYIQDNDLWQKKLPYSREITVYINSFERNFNSFENLINEFDNNFTNVVIQGTALLRYHKLNIEKIAQGAREYEWDNNRCVIINCPGLYASDMGNLLLERFKDVEFACIYYDTANGNRYYSLRSASDFNVAKFAEKFPGGGGHPRAAGFHINKKVKLLF